MLARSGFVVDLIDPGRSQAAASSRVSSRMAVKGRTEGIVARLLDEAASYDRVIVCDENLVAALAASADGRAAPLLPAHPEAVASLIDKTRFIAAAQSAGIRVPHSVVVADARGLGAALAAIGGPAVLKGVRGAGGTAVRRVTPNDAGSAAGALGYPLLVQELVTGDLRLMPCLFERGGLVAGFAASKARTVVPYGPSSVNVLRAVDERLRRVAESAGRAFGLHGFVSIDFFEMPDGSDPVVIEINPRPVPQLHLGTRVGVDMAAALRDAVAGNLDGAPRLGGDGRAVVLFPQELHRLRAERGPVAGTIRWLATPGALADVPWDDMGLVRRHLRRTN